VYRASTHGYSAESFHRHCDGVAPTYVIAMVGVFGLLNNNNNYNNNIYLLQLGCHPVAVVILHVYKT